MCDGYAASAEAMQAASLDPILDLCSSMTLFSSSFKVPADRERLVVALDPDAEDFAAQLADHSRHRARSRAGRGVPHQSSSRPRGSDAGPQATLTADDFFPNKEWRVLALASYMLPDPYTGCARRRKGGGRPLPGHHPRRHPARHDGGHPRRCG